MLVLSLIQMICSVVILGIFTAQRRQIRNARESASITDFLSDIHTVLEGQEKLLFGILNAVEKDKS